MAYVKPQAALKDLNTGDYFYPLTTIDLIITGNQRLSAYFSESSNKLTLTSISNITMSGNLSAGGSISGTSGSFTGDVTITKNTPNLHIRNTSTGNTYSIIRFGVSDNNNAAYIFLNSKERTDDGGLSMMTIRNNIGDIRLDNNVHVTGHQYNNSWITKERGLYDILGTRYVSTGGYTNTSTGTTRHTSIAGNPWAEYYYLAPRQVKTYASTATNAAVTGTTYSYGYFEWREYSFNSNTGARLNYVEGYKLPPVSDNLTASKWYTIITTKNPDLLYWANVKVSTGSSTDTSPTFSTCYTSNWFRSKGSTGWLSEDHGGGWYMSDNTWIRTYNNKAIYSGSGIIRSDSEVWGNKVVIKSDWLGFYNSVLGATRYGYVQANANRMYFRKENGVSTYHFDFNGHLYSTGQFVTAGDRSFRIIHNNRGAFWHWNANSGLQWFYLMFTAANDGFGGWTSIRAFLVNADTGYSYHTRAYSAVWNDYAEFRQGDTIEPGRVVTELKNGIMTMVQERLAPGAKIISDTYGFAIGETKKCKTPIAVTGRVLVYPFRDRNEYELGAAVCAAPGGTVDIMTREEIREYPERIVGTVSEIPTYTVWHAGGSVELGPAEEIQVNGRIWVYVR